MESEQRKLTFSQRQGLEPLPRPLALEELSHEARNRLWALFFETTNRNTAAHGMVVGSWNQMLYDCHIRLLVKSADEYNGIPEYLLAFYKSVFLQYGYNTIFDVLEFLMRHSGCPSDFMNNVKKIFSDCRLAYIIDT